MQKWKKIKKFKNYKVSKDGRVMNSKTKLILQPKINSCGYAQVELSKNGKSKKYLIHRLVAFAFLGKKLFKKEINHKNENKLDNRVENLEWCNHKYNMNYGSARAKISKALKKHYDK